jgi:tRNA(Ile)-lysidine synthase
MHALCDRIGAGRVVAGIVDHGLRQGSKDEARLAARIATAAGVAARVSTLAWEGSGRRSQAALRARRYAALCALARKEGADLIAVAHTADDQAETVFMRATRAGDWRGLAGMAPVAAVPLWPEGRGLRLARPFLGLRRAGLRAWLAQHGRQWIEDPSNQIVAYERVRARRRLATLERKGAEPIRLALLAERLRPMCDAVDQAAAAWLSRTVKIEDGKVSVPMGSIRGPSATRALACLIAAVSGAATPPTSARVASLAASLGELRFRGATLGGARVSQQDGWVRFCRDPGAVLGRAGVAPVASVGLSAGEPVVWDGRVLVCAHESGWLIEPAGEGGDPTAPRLRRGRACLTLAGAVRDGAADAEWLIGAHFRHLLPAFTPG